MAYRERQWRREQWEGCREGAGGVSKGQEGIGAEEGEDRIEREDKVKRRLSAQLIDSSTPTGINTRKPHMCVFACMHVHVPMCQS